MPGDTLFNGEPIAPGLSADRAFHFGDGLFETLAVVDGSPCLWNLHFRRLRDGCERLGIALPDNDQLLSEARQLAHGQSRAVLKIIVSAGQGGQGYARAAHAGHSRWLQIRPWPELQHYREHTAVHLQWCETRLGEQPLLAGIKHLNRLEQVLARRELRPPAVEGLLLDQQGRVIEGVSSNLLLQLGDTYLTPALGRCGVSGVVRRLLLDEADANDIEVRVTDIGRATVEQADRLYITNSLLGVRPVASLDGHVYPHHGLDAFLQGINRACFSPEEGA